MSAPRLNFVGKPTRTRLHGAGETALLVVGSVAVLTSAWVHYYLYFYGGYRDIAPDNFAGLTISRSFAVNAIAGFAIAWALVVSLRFSRIAVPGAVAGTGFAVLTLGAYLLSRTVGLLGFEDNQLDWEAVLAFVVELIALASLGLWLALRWRAQRERSDQPLAPSGWSSEA